MDRPLQKFIDTIHQMNEEAPTMNIGAGKIAGSVEAGDDPPVNKKKKKKNIYLGLLSRTPWLRSTKKK